MIPNRGLLEGRTGGSCVPTFFNKIVTAFERADYVCMQSPYELLVKCAKKKPTRESITPHEQREIRERFRWNDHRVEIVTCNHPDCKVNLKRRVGIMTEEIGELRTEFEEKATLTSIKFNKLTIPEETLCVTISPSKGIVPIWIKFEYCKPPFHFRNPKRKHDLDRIGELFYEEGGL